MGQQQLLLLTLSIIIVGLLVVVGINAFSQHQAKASADAMIVEGLNIASHIQSWASNTDKSLVEVTFVDLGYTHKAGTYQSANGTFTLDTSALAACGEVVIPSSRSARIYINGFDNAGDHLCVAIAGTQPDDIGTVAHYSGDDAGF